MGMTFITGASSGIGRSMARRLAADGEAVAVVARAAEEHFGPSTRLVANAGGGSPTNAEEFTAEHLAAVIDLNLIGAAHCIEAVLPGMLARSEGHLVATSSLAGIRGLPGAGAYSAAKAALTALMESLRVDLHARGIAVTVIAPGFVQTKPKRKKKTKRKAKQMLRLELEPATALMQRAIVRRRAYYAFPRTLVVLTWLGWMLPAPIFDRLLRGRGPKTLGPAAS